MVKVLPARSLFLILLFLISANTNTAVFSFPAAFSQYKTFLSLAHSLFTRVSNLRAARGDIAGASRAKLIAQNLERGFWWLGWSVGWDYVKNYAWRDFDYRELYGSVAELNELLVSLRDLGRAESELERTAWVGRNYHNVLRVAKSVLRRLVKVFSQSGVLKEVVETVEKEVGEGGLLRDCLEIGRGDLQGMVQIVKDVASQYYFTSHHNSDL